MEGSVEKRLKGDKLKKRKKKGGGVPSTKQYIIFIDSMKIYGYSLTIYFINSTSGMLQFDDIYSRWI